MKQTFLTEKQKPRRVDFFIHKEDFEAALLGSLGMTTRYIVSQTNLSGGKVTYRLKKAQVKRSDYRNGESPMARLVLKNLRPLAQHQLAEHLKRL